MLFLSVVDFWVNCDYKVKIVASKYRFSRLAAFTLIEVIVSAAVSAITIGGIIYGYVVSAQRAEWSAYSLAAQSMASQRLEQTRAAQWDTAASPIIDQLVSTNFPIQTNILDIPSSGTNYVWATNYTTITTISASAPFLRCVRVDCVWPFRTKRYTNTVITYRAPDTY
jgi:type II secretory pathway pseudopilin PulG